MALNDFLSEMGYGGTPHSISRGKNADYFGLYGDERLAAFLQDQSKSGYLSPSSVNPEVRQLVEGGVSSEQFRQENLARSLAAAGVNPAIAERIISEDKGRAMADLSARVAGFEGNRQKREFEAGEDFIGFQSQLEQELTARAEDRRRYNQQVREAKKARNLQMLTSVLGIAANAFAPGIGAMFGAGGKKDGGGPAEGQTGYDNQNQHGGGFEPVEAGAAPPGMSAPAMGGPSTSSGMQSYPGGPSFGSLFGQSPFGTSPGGGMTPYQGMPPQSQYGMSPFGRFQGTPFGGVAPSWWGPRNLAFGR